MKTCVYTVLLGGYDALLEQEVAAGSDSEFICFTDDPQLSSDTWEIVRVAPRFPQDLHRSSRVLKILGHERLAEFDSTLCIDASVRLRRDPRLIIEDWLTGDVDMALAAHSYRDQIVDEFDEVIRLNYDDRARVYEQLVDYSIAYPDVLEARPHWGGMLVRRRTPEVEGAMRLWFDHVLRYSRRDQLSLMVALLHGGVRFRSLELDNFGSEYHEWPVISERRVSIGKASTYPPGPMVSELRRALRRITELEQEIARLEGHEVEARESRAKLNEATDRVEELAGQLRVAEATTAEYRERADNVAASLAAVSGIRGAARNMGSAVGAWFRRRA